MIDRFLSQTSFSSQEDFVKNLKIHVPDNNNNNKLHRHRKRINLHPLLRNNLNPLLINQRLLPLLLLQHHTTYIPKLVKCP